MTEVPQTSLEELSLRKATNECIRDVIDGLPEKCRIPLILSKLEGFTNREIVEILDISLETAKVRLHRAKAQLKRKKKTEKKNELSLFPISFVYYEKGLSQKVFFNLLESASFNCCLFKSTCGSGCAKS